MFLLLTVTIQFVQIEFSSFSSSHFDTTTWKTTRWCWYEKSCSVEVKDNSPTNCVATGDRPPSQSWPSGFLAHYTPALCEAAHCATTVATQRAESQVQGEIDWPPLCVKTVAPLWSTESFSRGRTKLACDHQVGDKAKPLMVIKTRACSVDSTWWPNH